LKTEPKYTAYVSTLGRKNGARLVLVKLIRTETIRLRFHRRKRFLRCVHELP
jgi:hypothetical protein